MTITNSSTRLAALVAGVAVALALMGAVAVAPAQAAGLTSAQVQAIVSLLASFGADQATINNVTAALQGQATTGTGGTNGGVCPVLTRSLQLGSSGADVMSLQKFLNGSANTRVSVSGAGSPGLETTYFGPATQSAVVKFQASNNVSAIGVVGPATRAAIAAVCGTVVTPGTGTGTGTGTGSTVLQGGEGQLNNIGNITADVESEVNEGQEENVFGLEMDAEDSDIMVERVDVDFTLADANTTESDNLDDYITEVSLVLDGKTLATMDVDEADVNDAGDGDFTNAADGNDVYSFRFTGLKGVIKEDDTADLYVMVTAVNNVDTSDVTGDWYVLISDDGIRAVDAAGISDTYVSGSESDEEIFSVVAADAGDLDLTVTGSDNEDRIISVSADSDTNGEEIMVFKLESNTSNNNVSDIRVDLSTTTATSTLVSTAINQVKLYQGSTLLGTSDVEGANGDQYATFDNLDIDIDEDEEVEFTVKADFNDEADTREGFSFEASVIGANVDAEDAEGDNVTVAQTVTGGDIELRTTGMSATFKSADEVRTNGSNTGDADSVDFTIKFSVTAVGDEDIYLDGDTTLTQAAGTDGVQWATTTDSSALASTSATAILTADDGYQSDDVQTAGAKSFLIESGETRNFTFRVNLAAGTDNQNLGVKIDALQWDTDSGEAHANTYDFDMSDWTTDTITGLYIR